MMLWKSSNVELRTWFDRVWLDFVGRTLEEELGRGWEAGVHPEDVGRCLNAYRAAFEARERFSVEYRLRRYDGEYRSILEHGAPCLGGNGAFHGYIGSAVEIGERAHGGRTGEDPDAQSRRFAEALPNLVWTCEPDGWCDYLSRQWVEYTGRPAEEQVGYGWADHVHPDDRERVRAEWQAATVRGDCYETEFRIRDASGTYRWFQTRAVPLRDATGRVVKWFGSNTDCEDRKRAETQLRLQLERMRLRELVRARRARRTDPPPPVTQGEYRVGWVVRNGPRESRPRRRRDEPFTGTSTGITERFEARHPASPFQAIEARRFQKANSDLERRVRQRTLELEVANEEVESFCTFATEDALSPLRAVRALSERLGEEFSNVLPLRAADMLRRLDANAGKLDKLVRDLLWLGRLSRRPMSRKDVDLDRLVARVADQLVQSHATGVRDIQIRAGVLGRCCGDPGLLEQVFSSLLCNALECTLHKGKTSIEIARSEEEEGVVYSVKDNGMGFDMNHAQRLFIPFQRLHAGRSPEGSGVGLAAAYRIVQRHGGQIWAKGMPGRGATFYFTIPPVR